MRKIVLDLETVSDINLKKHDVKRYVASPHTRISVLSFFDFKTNKQITLYDETLSHIRNDLSEEDKQLVADVFGDALLVIIAHNASFEKTVLDAKLMLFLRRNVFTEEVFSINKEPTYVCTATWANIMRSPASLMQSAKYFKLDMQKDNNGHALMMKICSPMVENTTKGRVRGVDYIRVELEGKPFKGGREVYERMGKYCEQDVKATFKLYKQLVSKEQLEDLGEFLPITKAGVKLTEKMNTKGVRLDQELLPKLLHVKDVVYNKLDEVTAKYFGVPAAAEREAVKIAVSKIIGKDIEKLGKKEINTFLHYNKVDPKIEEGLRLYAKYNMSSFNKAQKAADIHQDNRLTGLLKYSGAYATSRWTSFGFQLQNLPRSTQDSPDEAIAYINAHWQDEQKILEAPEKFQDGIRGLVLPDEGYKFYITDLKGIEARLALFNTGYEDKMEEMHNGTDLYVELAKKMFNTDEVSAAQRNNGKSTHFLCQYQGGAVKLRNSLADFGVYITEKEADRYVNAFRKKYPKMRREWYRLDALVKKAYFTKKPFKVQLRSGRWLNYGKLIKHEFKDKVTGELKKQIAYDTGAKKDRYQTLYGGKVFQHTIQAEARDIMLIKMLAMDAMGFELRMTVHDEVIILTDGTRRQLTYDKVWKKAGDDRIQEYWNGLKIDSDSVVLDRYWSH